MQSCKCTIGGSLQEWHAAKQQRRYKAPRLLSVTASLMRAPAQVADGDVIRIDAERRSMDVLGLDDAEWDRRRAAFRPLPLKARQGTLYKYIKAVSSASLGCVTDL